MSTLFLVPPSEKFCLGFQGNIASIEMEFKILALGFLRDNSQLSQTANRANAPKPNEILNCISRYLTPTFTHGLWISHIIWQPQGIFEPATRSVTFESLGQAIQEIVDVVLENPKKSETHYPLKLTDWQDQLVKFFFQALLPEHLEQIRLWYPNRTLSRELVTTT